jgi:hypothetical protein
MSKQFQLFGELFDESIKKGPLTAIQTQHPGFYFHPSANHAIQRRNYHKDLVSILATQKPHDSKILDALNQLEFYGQRPWRQGQQAIEILDQQKEKDGILCLLELESKEIHTVRLHFDKRMSDFHSWLLVNSYVQAIDNGSVQTCNCSVQAL